MASFNAVLGFALGISWVCLHHRQSLIVPVSNKSFKLYFPVHCRLWKYISNLNLQTKAPHMAGGNLSCAVLATPFSLHSQGPLYLSPSVPCSREKLPGIVEGAWSKSCNEQCDCGQISSPPWPWVNPTSVRESVSSHACAEWSFDVV